MFRELLNVQRRVLGPEHPETLSTLGNLGCSLREQVKHAEAEQMFREQLDMRRRVLGLEHPHTLDTVRNLASLDSIRKEAKVLDGPDGAVGILASSDAPELPVAATDRRWRAAATIQACWCANRDLRRPRAARKIQASWRAIRDIRGAGADAANLRLSCQTRKKIRAIISSVRQTLDLLAAASAAVTEHSRLHGCSASDGREAWLAIRAAASRIVQDSLPFVTWCDSWTPVAESVRVLVPLKAPLSLGGRSIDGSLAPSVASVFLQSMELRAVSTVLGAAGLVPAFLLFFDLYTEWWLGLFVVATWPLAMSVAACLNRATLKQLLRMFHTVFFGVLTLVMFGTLCFLWRNHPVKIAALVLGLPNFLLSVLIDAYPEAGRPMASITFFGLNVVCVSLLQAGVVFSQMQLDDYTITIFPGRSTKATSIVSGAMIGVLTFGVKNIFFSLLKPGSLCVVKSNLQSVRLPPHALQIARTAHALVTLLGAQRNPTLKDELLLSKANSGVIVRSFWRGGRRSAVSHYPSTSGEVSSVDLLPISAGDSSDGSLPVHAAEAWAEPDRIPHVAEPQAHEQVSVIVDLDVHAASGPRVDGPNYVPCADGAVGKERASAPAASKEDILLGIAASLARESEALRRKTCFLLARSGASLHSSLAYQICSARADALLAVDEAMRVAHSTNFCVLKSDVTLCHVPSATPCVVENLETLLPWLSAFIIQHRTLRLGIDTICPLLWFAGATSAYLLCFEVHAAVWMVVMAVGTLPGILFLVLACNRKLLRGIATSFQTVLVCSHATIMIAAICALFRNQPLKLFVVLLFLPSVISSAFLDGYPEERRTFTSRIFFTLNLLGLLANQAGLAFGLWRTDELYFYLYGGWSFKASELAGGAISSLIPFAIRNLVASVSRARTLAVRQSDVVCVGLDAHALRVLQAVHAFLTEEMHRASEHRSEQLVVGLVAAAASAL